MAIILTSGGGAGGAGTVTAVSSTNTGIAVANPNTTPALTLATLDVIAVDGPPAANWSNNSKKITALANGSAASDAAAFGQIPTALPPNGSAGGDLSGTYPNPTVTGGTHLTAASVAIASLADPTTGKVIGSASNAAAAVFPPGYEIGYDQTTSSINITGTSSGSPTTVIAGSAYTFDGNPVMVEFFCATVQPPSANGDFLVMGLYESTTLIDFIEVKSQAAAALYLPVSYRKRFTPTAASHTYAIKAWVSVTTGSPFVGQGGSSAPTFLRFTKV